MRHPAADFGESTPVQEPLEAAMIATTMVHCDDETQRDALDELAWDATAPQRDRCACRQRVW